LIKLENKKYEFDFFEGLSQKKQLNHHCGTLSFCNVDFSDFCFYFQN